MQLKETHTHVYGKRTMQTLGGNHDGRCCNENADAVSFFFFLHAARRNKCLPRVVQRKLGV